MSPKQRILLALLTIASSFVILPALAQTARSPRAIYRCEVDGVPTYSDHACGADARRYQADEKRVSSYRAPPAKPPAAARAASAKSRAAAGSSHADRQARDADECERLRASLSEIRSQMRAGYNARQGERLRAREAKLKDRRRERRCR